MHGFQLIEKGVSNLPWQERPKKVNGAPIWRYSQNPVIGRIRPRVLHGFLTVR